MFTGIIEAIGTLKRIENQGTNSIFWIESPLSSGFKTDQSVAHSGVCLTIEAVEGDLHRVTAVAETIQKTNLSEWKTGEMINLERCVQFNGRLDGHLVLGHVDTTAICIDQQVGEGSWEFTFKIDKKFAPLIIEKGSISLNGISLTIFNVTDQTFTVAIIPYTYKHTNIHRIKISDAVNIEFDMIGKYINRAASLKVHDN